MKNNELYKSMEIERKKLNSMVRAANKDKRSFTNEQILKQSCKVDTLINELQQQEDSRRRKNES